MLSDSNIANCSLTRLSTPNLLFVSHIKILRWLNFLPKIKYKIKPNTGIKKRTINQAQVELAFFLSKKIMVKANIKFIIKTEVNISLAYFISSYLPVFFVFIPICHILFFL